MMPNSALSITPSKKRITMMGESKIAPKNRYISFDLNRVVT
jgi:hypothetical protein